jgi:hypothetical protein
MKTTIFSVLAALGVIPVTAFAAATSVVTFIPKAPDVQCPIVTTYMKQGLPNSPAEVTRLQKFLKGSEGLAVDVNGTYDQKTEDAVKAFQKKHADTILTPWGATRATGAVYITTGKTINMLACGQKLSLNNAELKTISSYQAHADAASAAMASGEEAGPVVTYTTSAHEEDSAGTAASLNASIVGKFWFYLKNLF